MPHGLFAFLNQERELYVASKPTSSPHNDISCCSMDDILAAFTFVIASFHAIGQVNAKVTVPFSPCATMIPALLI
jgi:hypothetical protein